MSTANTKPHESSLVRSYKGSVTNSNLDFESRTDRAHSAEVDYLQMYLYPLIGEANRSVSTNKVIHLLQYFIIFVQVFLGSYYSIYGGDSLPPGLKTLYQIFFFNITSTDNSMKVFFAVLFIINLLTFIIVIGMCIDYALNHEFRKSLLNVIRHWHGGLYNYFHIPNTLFFFDSLGYYGGNPSGLQIVLIILGFLSCIYTFAHIFYLSIVLNHSPFLSNLVGMMWIPKHYFFQIALYAFAIGTQGLFHSYDDWTKITSQIITVLVCMLTMYHALNSPFSFTTLNAIFAALPISVLFGSILAIVREFIPISDPIYYIIPLVVYIIAFIAMYLMFYFLRLKAKKYLSINAIEHEEGEDIREDMKYDHLDKYIKNVNQCFWLLHVGLEEASDLFLDWSLHRYCTQNYVNDGDLLLFMTWLVSFFPSETNIFHSYIQLAFRMQDPSYDNKVMFYQLHRVHIFRQSSASKEAAKDFYKIRVLTSKCVAKSCQFWKNLANPAIDVDHSAIVQLSKIHRQAELSWVEMLDKYPNNSRFAYEYSRFLLDGVCNFTEAIKWHQRALGIENGKRILNDRMFHKFIQMYPHYLKNGVVNTRGSFINKSKKLSKDSSASNSSTLHMSTSSISYNEDESDSDEIIDQDMAAQFLPQMALRTALQNYVNNLNSDVSARIRVWSLLRLIISIIFVLIAILLPISSYDSRVKMFNHLNNYNKISYYLFQSTIQYNWLLYSSYNDTEVPDTKTLLSILGNTEGIPEVIPFTKDHRFTTYSEDRKGLDKVNVFAQYLYDSNMLNTEEITDLAILYSENKVGSAYCDPDANPYYSYDDVTIDFLIRAFFTSMMKQVGAKTAKMKKWVDNDNFCEGFVQSWNLQDICFKVGAYFSPFFNHYLNEFIDYNISLIFNKDATADAPDANYTKESVVKGEIDYSNQEAITRQSYIILSITPFILLLLTLPSIIYLQSGVVIEQESSIQALQTVNPEDCLKASIPLQHDISKQSNDANFTNDMKFHTTPSWLLNFITAIIIIALIVVVSVLTIEYNSQFTTILEQYNLVGIQRNLMYDVGGNAIFLIFTHYVETYHVWLSYDEVKNKNKTAEEVTFTNTPKMVAQLNRRLKQLSLLQKMIVTGFDHLDPVIGTDSVADDIRFTPTCTPDIGQSFEVDFYRCLSFDRLLSYYLATVKSVVAAYSTMNMTAEPVMTLTHMLQSIIPIKYNETLTYYTEKFNKKLETYTIIAYVILAVSIILTVIAFLTELVIIKGIDRQLETFKSMILKLNPLAFVSSHSLLTLFSKKNHINDNNIQSAAQAVFYTSRDAMISMNSEGIIEHLNPSATSIFGYTPEQMLGQNLKMLINNDPSGNQDSQLFYTMQLMKSGQCSLIYETNTLGTRDDGTNVPLMITLLGFSANDRVAESFALICKDQTEEVQQNQAVERAKHQSELILLQILPKDIIMRLNRGDQDISFSVPSASIIFIDIEKFSQYSASLSAKDIMTNLSKIFTTFDKICTQFDQITKIKLIGDIYMAAGGLFSPDLDPSTHANQVLQFALQALDAIEELNIQLNASLQVRIGINSGGPLIAGVLGTDKPLFDIIGDPINIAARLQSTDIAGLVQISQGCYDLVANGPYKIEQRGEIELKGKGKRMTYLVYPQGEELFGPSSGRGSMIAGDDDINKSNEILQSFCSGHPSIEIKGNIF